MGADTDLPLRAGPLAQAAHLDLGPLGWTRFSFQSRIAMVALATAVTVLLAACSLFMLEQFRAQRDVFARTQGHVAEVAAAEAAHALSTRDGDDLTVLIAALKRDTRAVGAQVAAPDGRILAGFGVSAANPQDLVIRTPIVSQGRQLGVLVLHARRPAAAALMPRFLWMGSGLLVMAAGLALLMGRWLAGRLTRPVERLSLVMQEVARSGDFARRVAHADEDEFGRLTRSFNALLAQLERNDLALRSTVDALVEARDAAQAANVLKSQFLANMSHEIRTPLNGVMAMAQIMALDQDLGPAQREKLTVISQSGEALLAVLNDVLDLSKIEAGRMELEQVEFDLDALARAVEAAHAPVAARKGLGFSVEVTADAAGARVGDPARLQQILNNLISNALKFTQTGEVRAVIAGDGEAGSEGLRLTVKDTGIGIPADKLPQLFQKFMQVDASITRRFGGTGLGLAICRELAQLMDGEIWAESRPGAGSSFVVRLPIQRAYPDASRPAPEPGRGVLSAVRVLAAEDNPTNQLVLRAVMQSFGLEVDMVEDGGQVIEAWARGGYDLILMDIQMPGIDGLAAARAIREMERKTGKPRTPIIALSANAMTHQVREYLEAGMDLHVAKPLQIGKLQEALETALRGVAAAGPVSGEVRAHQS